MREVQVWADGQSSTTTWLSRQVTAMLTATGQEGRGGAPMA
jgi:hypothetical protein